MIALDHPLVDGVVDGIVVSESRAPVLALTATRADLLVQAGLARQPLVVCTGDATRLTESLRSALVATRTPWVVSTAGGLRDGLTLRPLADLASAFAAPGAGPPHPDALYLEQPTTLQLIASVSMRHRAAPATRLGAAAEAFAGAGGGAPVAWGPNEPAEYAWDRDAFTAFARERMPRETRLLVTGDGAHPLTGVVTARRTARGVEEITEVLVGLGAVDDPRAETRADDAVLALDDLALSPWPLVALLFTRPGRGDLTASAFVAPRARPLALMIGAPAVRDLGLDVPRWSARFGARVAGRPRTPALVVALRRPGGAADAGWSPLRDIVEELGAERVAELTGLRIDLDRWGSR